MVRHNLGILIGIFASVNLVLSASFNFLNGMTAIQKSQGDKHTELLELFDAPFAYMEEQIKHAPLALGIMGNICKLAKNISNDVPINLNDGNTNPERFKLIKYPEDFTATLNQLVDDTYWAFQKADGAMFDIELNTRDVEIYTKNAANVLFMGNPYEIKQFFPPQVKQLKKIAQTCSNRTSEIEEKFDHLIKLTSEIISAAAIKESASIKARKLIENELQTVRDREVAEKLLIEEQGKQINELRGFTKYYQDQYKIAADGLLLTNEQIEELAEFDMQTVCNDPIIKFTKKCTSHKGQCISECINGQCYIKEPVKNWDYCTREVVHKPKSRGVSKCDSNCGMGGESYYWCWTTEGPFGSAGQWYDYCTIKYEDKPNGRDPCINSCINGKCVVKDVPTATAKCNCEDIKHVEEGVCNKVLKPGIGNFGNKSTTVAVKMPVIDPNADPNDVETQYVIQVILDVQKIAQEIAEDFMLPDGTLDLKALQPNNATLEMIIANKTQLEANLDDIVNAQGKTEPKFWSKAKEFTENLLKTLQTLETKYNDIKEKKPTRTEREFELNMKNAASSYSAMFDDGNTTLVIEIKILDNLLLKSFQPIFVESGNSSSYTTNLIESSNDPMDPIKLAKIQSSLDDIKENLQIAMEKEAPSALVNNTINLVNALIDVLAQLPHATTEEKFSKLSEKVKNATTEVRQLKQNMTKEGTDGANRLIAYQMRLALALADNIEDEFIETKGDGSKVIKKGPEVQEKAKKYNKRFLDIEIDIKAAEDAGAKDKFVDRARKAIEALSKMTKLIALRNETDMQNENIDPILIPAFKDLTKKLTKFVSVDIPILTNEPPHEKVSPGQAATSIIIPADGSSVSKKLIGAHAATLSAQYLLDTAHQRQQKAMDAKIETMRKVNEFNVKMRRLERDGFTLESVVDVLGKGLALLSNMNEHWKHLHTYFDKLAMYVDHAIADKLEYFIDMTTEQNINDSIQVQQMGNYGKSQIFDITRYVNENAYLINGQAKAYYYASTAFIIPTVNAMSNILFGDEDYGALDTQLQVNLPKEYKNFFDETKADYDEKIRTNKAALKNMDVFKAVESQYNVPGKVREEVTKEIKKDIKCKLADYAPDVKTDMMEGLEDIDQSHCTSNEFDDNVNQIDGVNKWANYKADDFI